MSILEQLLPSLACPRLKKPLRRWQIDESDRCRLRKIKRSGLEASDYGFGDDLEFLTAGDGRYYGVADGFPILLYPEILVAADDHETVDLLDPRYHEAYEEMQHYNSVGNRGAAQVDQATLRRFMGALVDRCPGPQSFPDEEAVWIDARHDGLAQLDAYRYLAPLQGKRFLHLGGSGSHAIKALLAGAKSATLLTPMLGEARQGRGLAQRFDVADRFNAVIAIGEELPFVEALYEAIYSGGCIHHMRTEYTFAELNRVLTQGGRFSSVDPWKTTLHKIGTHIFGKRERGVFCRPIDPVRLAPLKLFSKHAVTRHGPFMRYPMIVLDKFGVTLPITTMLKLARVDDFLGRVTGTLNVMSGSIMFAGEKASTELRRRGPAPPPLP